MHGSQLRLWATSEPGLTDDFRECSRLPNAHRVEYLLVGGYAVGLRGYSPATVDLDIRVRPQPDNAKRVMKALRAFGFDLPGLQPQFFVDPQSIVRFGVPPFRIEIMTSIDGVAYDACQARAIVMMLDDVPVPVISLQDLKVNKRAAGCYKDLADLDNLP